VFLCNFGNDVAKVLLNQVACFFPLSFGVKYKRKIPAGHAPVRYLNFYGAELVEFVTAHADSHVTHTRSPAQQYLECFADIARDLDLAGITAIILHAADIGVNQLFVALLFRQEF